MEAFTFSYSFEVYVVIQQCYHHARVGRNVVYILAGICFCLLRVESETEDCVRHQREGDG